MMRTMEYFKMRSNKRHGRPYFKLSHYSGELLQQDLLVCDLLTFEFGNVSKILTQFKKVFNFKTLINCLLLKV